jgi:LysR family transcriptional regulator, nitrogen assimilation regulatory protein
MDLRQIRYFVTVAERGSFSSAASALNVAQSALSRHVKDLEIELGGALLERGVRGVALTESGKLLLTRGRWLLGAVDDIETDVRTESRELSGTVRLGAPASIAEIFYAPLAQNVSRRFPRVRLELSQGLTETMCDRLLRAEVDLAVVTDPQPNNQLSFETLVVERIFLIGAPGDPLLKRGKLTRKEFNSLPNAIAPFGRNRFPLSVPISVRVESSTPMKQCAALGLGYGILPYSGIHTEVTAGTLSAAWLPWFHGNRVLALPRGRRASRATHEAVDILRAICRDLIGAGKILPMPTRARTRGKGTD